MELNQCWNQGFHGRHWTFMGRSSQYCLPGCREGGGGETLGVECHYKYDSWAGFADSVVFVLLLYWRPLDWSVLCGFHPGKDLAIELSFFCLFVFSHFIVIYLCYVYHAFHTWAPVSDTDCNLYPYIINWWIETLNQLM